MYGARSGCSWVKSQRAAHGWGRVMTVWSRVRVASPWAVTVTSQAVRWGCAMGSVWREGEHELLNCALGLKAVDAARFGKSLEARRPLAFGFGQ